ncbi:MAG: hypothetical protein WCT25_03380 [Candidatus Paceibacterota bacterium]
MADKKTKPTQSAGKDFMSLVAIMILIIIAWVWTGGYNRPIATQGPYLIPPTTIGENSTGYGSLPKPLEGLVGSGGTGPTDSNTGQTNNNQAPQTPTGPASAVADILPDKGISVYADLVLIDSTYGAIASNPQQEYITIRAASNNAKGVNITGWKIASGATGNGYPIGGGTQIFRSGQLNSEGAIVLTPGERAIISTGRSPVGYSFRGNKCSGYLNQFQTFTPIINYQCPAARDANIPLDPQSFNDTCRDYIDRISLCQMPTEIFPFKAGNTCQDFITAHFNYNGCVDDHLNDTDFYSTSEWRVFLNRTDEIWKSKREIIKLIDSAGNTVDISSY